MGHGRLCTSLCRHIDVYIRHWNLVILQLNKPRKINKLSFFLIRIVTSFANSLTIGKLDHRKIKVFLVSCVLNSALHYYFTQLTFYILLMLSNVWTLLIIVHFYSDWTFTTWQLAKILGIFVQVLNTTHPCKGGKTQQSAHTVWYPLTPLIKHIRFVSVDSIVS